MKFKKILTIGIDETQLDEKHWVEVDTSAERRVSISKDSTEIQKELVDADCLLVATWIPVTKEMLDIATDLKYIGVLGTAYGKIDTDYAREKGVVVSNLAGYSTESVAEFTMAAILENIRQLEEGKERGRAGNYSEAGIKAREIKGSIFGVIGLGSIGRRVAELAHGFGADVRYWSKQPKDAPFKYQDADTIIAEADFLSLNLALAPETKNFLDKKRIDSIKGGAIVINTVPMEVVDTNALAERLAVGDITFIFDHPDETPKETMDKLSKSKKCIVYPPMAYITDEARAAKQKVFVENIKNFLKGYPTNRVN